MTIPEMLLGILVRIILPCIVVLGVAAWVTELICGKEAP